jgi:predicted MFS family arabinose efflux permease
LSCFCISFNTGALIAILSVIAQDLGLSDFSASKIIPYYMIPYGISALIYAPLIRIVSYRTVLVATTFIFAVTCFICAHSVSFAQILFARILMGIVAASSIPLGLMMIGELFEKNIRGRLVGVFFGTSFVASLLGIILSGVSSWRWLFYVPAIFGFITAMGFLFFKNDFIDRTHAGVVNYLKVFDQRRVVNIFIFIAFISLLYHGVQKWFGVYLSHVYRLDKLTISFVFILITVGSFLGQLFGGYLSDKKGRNVACYLGLMGLAGSTVFLAGQYSFFVLTFILIVFSASWTIGHNGISTVLTDFADADRPAMAGLNSSVRFIAGGVGFYLTGFVAQKSFSVMFLTVGILMFLLIFSLKKVLA